MLTGPMTARRSNATNAYDLMSDIRKYITEEPKRIWMADWITEGHSEIKATFGVKGPACGTVGCIAGNTVVLTGADTGRDICTAALDTLSGNNHKLRDRLHYNVFLDVEVGARYGSKRYAQIVSKRIRDFQKEHEDELRAVRIEPGPKNGRRG